MALRAAETGVGSEVMVLLVFTVEVLGVVIGALFSVSELVLTVVLGIAAGFGFFHIFVRSFRWGSLAQGADSWGISAD
jgi:hypothetical protein